MSHVFDRPYSKLPRVLSGCMPCDNLIGVEVELEGADDWSGVEDTLHKSGVWEAHEDGSLKRAGIELVMQQPLAGDDIRKALLELRGVIKTFGLVASARTGIHVHVDTRQLTRHELKNLLLLYTLSEDLLYRVGGEDRRYNNNCRPSSSNDEFLRTIRCCADSEDVLQDITNHLSPYDHKYTGLNVGSLVKSVYDDVIGVDCYRGSLEFRMHEGTKNTNRIMRWIKLLLAMVRYAKSDKCARFLWNVQNNRRYGRVDNSGAAKIVSEVFGDQYRTVNGAYKGDKEGLVHAVRNGVSNIRWIGASTVSDSALVDSLNDLLKPTTPWKVTKLCAD